MNRIFLCALVMTGSTVAFGKLPPLDDAAKATGNAPALFNTNQHSVSSRYFEIQGKLQVEQTTVQEYSVVQRDGLDNCIYK